MASGALDFHTAECSPCAPVDGLFGPNVFRSTELDIGGSRLRPFTALVVSEPVRVPTVVSYSLAPAPWSVLPDHDVGCVRASSGPASGRRSRRSPPPRWEFESPWDTAPCVGASMLAAGASRLVAERHRCQPLGFPIDDGRGTGQSGPGSRPRCGNPGTRSGGGSRSPGHEARPHAPVPFASVV